MTRLKPDRSVLRRLLAAAGRERSSDRHRHGRQKPASQPPAWRQVVRRRLLVAAGVFGVWSLGIEARLVYLQVLSHDELVARAERQQNESIEVHPKRGEILDREGRVLAYSVDADSIYAVPTEIDQPEKTAAQLCSALDNCSQALQETMEARLRQPGPFAFMKRQVSTDEARLVAELELDGVGFLKESRRYYPNRELAAHLLGYVGTESQGLSGIESTYDAEISGRPGVTLIQTDARHQAFSRIERLPTTGAAIELTIDKYLQHIAERELQVAVRDHQADAGSIVILSPQTGEVLALANAPTFNPNVFADASERSRRNRAVQDAYEPGSTFKLVTAAAALEERIVDRDEFFDVSAGDIRIGRDRISDMHNNGVLSFDDVIVKSSNVGAVMIGLRLGPERLSRYVRRLGFGESLSRYFPGEHRGLVSNPADLDDRGLASLSMGYQVAVTPLQLAAAVSAVANGGELLEPKAVRAVIRDGIRAETSRRVIRRAISPDTAAELTSIMEAVVGKGTARSAQITGYTVAGKTGTAEKVIDGAYSNVDHVASFVGFVPSRKPVLTILVVIDTPRGAVDTGGAVAAPVFQRVAEAALRHLAVPPTVNPSPPILVARSMKPQVLRLSARSPAPKVLVPAPDAKRGRGLMPDLRGLSAREALNALDPLSLVPRLEGFFGYVASHEPGPGVPVDRGASVILRLEREPVNQRDLSQ